MNGIMENTLFCGSFHELMKNLPDNYIDLTVTSPSYDNLKDYDGMPPLNWHLLIDDLFRTTKEGGVVVWVVADATHKSNETGTSFRQALEFKQVGFNLFDTMVWYKPNCFNFGSNDSYRSSFEFMFVFSKGKPKTINLIKDVKTKSNGKILKGARKHKDGSRDIVPDFIGKEYKKRDNVWIIPTANENFGHPAVFPYQLAHDHILTWTNPKDLVFDPLFGSGTTLKAGKDLDRCYLGSEINKNYVEIAQGRLK